MRLTRIALLVSVLTACAERSTPSAANTGAGAAGVSGAGGNAASDSGGGTAPGPQAGTGSATDRPCTPALEPGDEFFVGCTDASVPQLELDAGTPAALDASIPGTQPDASVAPEPDAGEPPDTLDEGPCATRTTGCDVGHGETALGTATCTINGNAVAVEREICEVCSKPTVLMDFGVVIMDCGVCAQVFRGSGFTDGEPIAANACRSRSDAIDLAWTQGDPFCVDVYAYVGSGVTIGAGTSLEVADEVRVCRCDRTTDTCISCVDGACDALP